MGYSFILIEHQAELLQMRAIEVIAFAYYYQILKTEQKMFTSFLRQQV
jgi:hypothetical protein